MKNKIKPVYLGNKGRIKKKNRILVQERTPLQSENNKVQISSKCRPFPFENKKVAFKKGCGHDRVRK